VYVVSNRVVSTARGLACARCSQYGPGVTLRKMRNTWRQTVYVCTRYFGLLTQHDLSELTYNLVKGDS